MYKVNFILIILLSTALNSLSQEFKFFAHAFYGSSTFEFKDTSEPYANYKLSAVPIYGLQTSVNLMMTNSFGMGSGINYMKMKGATDPVFIDSRLINPNATGDFTFEVNSSYLQIPIEFTLVMTQKWRAKPFLAAGLSFFIPLNESYLAKIDPTDPSNLYSTFETEVKESNEIWGFTIGLGTLISLRGNEMSVRFNYRINSLNYEDGISNILLEQRVLKFNTIEFAVGFRFLKIPLRIPEKK